MFYFNFPRFKFFSSNITSHSARLVWTSWKWKVRHCSSEPVPVQYGPFSSFSLLSGPWRQTVPAVDGRDVSFPEQRRYCFVILTFGSDKSPSNRIANCPFRLSNLTILNMSITVFVARMFCLINRTQWCTIKSPLFYNEINLNSTNNACTS